MESRIDAKIPAHIQRRMTEEEYKAFFEHAERQDKTSLFDAWKKRGCPDVEMVNKTIW